MLTLTLMLIAMSVEAPRIAQQIKREKEEELVHRGKDYATAVKRFVHKNGGRYPLSVEQLEDTNHIRFLRKKYEDPMTGESDWKMVHVGEAEIKIPAPNPIWESKRPHRNADDHSAALSQAAVATGGRRNIIAEAGSSHVWTVATSSGTGTLQTHRNIGNGQTVGGGQIMGVASVSKKQAIKEFNDKDHYDEWYFVYDLRLEQSGGSGVTVAAPRGGASPQEPPAALGLLLGPSSTVPSGTPDSGGSQIPPPPPGQPTPTVTPTPTPSPVPN